MILSNSRPGSGFGRYSQSLYESTNGYSDLFNILPSDNYDDKNTSGIPVSGTLTKFRKFNSAVKPLTAMERIATPILFSKFKKTVREHKKEEGIVHYSYEYVPFIDFSYDNIVTIHDLIVLNKNYEFKRLDRFYSELMIRHYLKFGIIIAPSNEVKRQIIELGSEASVEVIHHPVSKTFYTIKEKKELRKQLGLPLDKKLVLSISNTAPWKNLKRVREAVSFLGPDYQLVRVGARIGESITFTNVDGSTLNKIYNACDLLLFPSLEEGFGFPIIEAFTVGLPVVASEIPVLEEVSGRAAILIQPDNISSIVSGIKEAMNNVNSLTEKGYSLARNYTLEAFSKKMYNFYSWAPTKL